MKISSEIFNGSNPQMTAGIVHDPKIEQYYSLILKVKQLQLSNQRFIDMLESMSECLFSLDNQLCFTYLNGPAERAIHITRDQVLGKCILDIYHTEEPNEWQLAYEKVMREKTPFYGELFDTFSERWYQVYLYPSRDGGIIGFFCDITERRQLEQEIARLDRLNLIGQMAASISHEIRNPITTVRGYLQYFEKKAQYAEHREQIRTMIDELDRANLIITEYLALSKNKTIDMKRGNLNKVLATLFPLLQADALHSGHAIEMKTMPIPDMYFDEKEIRQLILNLVRNAIEAMPNGGTVTIETCHNYETILLSIQDRGLGITPEALDKLGTPFFTTKPAGTGLGLAVCYRIAQRHKAEIKVKTSTTGTTFFLLFNQQSSP